MFRKKNYLEIIKQYIQQQQPALTLCPLYSRPEGRGFTAHITKNIQKIYFLSLMIYNIHIG